jgi:hypothetical protein
MQFDEVKKFSTPAAFRASLDQRLRDHATKHKVAIRPVRVAVAFDRFLARATALDTQEWVLKGGYALQLRGQHGRSTKDLDLMTRDQSSSRQNAGEDQAALLREKLRLVVAVNLNDYFSFEVTGPTTLLTHPAKGGARFTVKAFVGGKVYEQFTIDAVVSELDPVFDEEIVAQDWLGFAGIEPPRIRVLPKEQQFAEKLHAYTLPREDNEENSRVRDLVDLAVMIRQGLAEDAVEISVKLIFAIRNRQDKPDPIDDPPVSWTEEFNALAAESNLPFSMSDAISLVRTFVDGLKLE